MSVWRLEKETGLEAQFSVKNRHNQRPKRVVRKMPQPFGPENRKKSPAILEFFTTAAPTNAMPIYEYQCKKCEHQFETMQKISEGPLKKCPECGKLALTKLVSAAGFRLKGGGWYETDFKSGNKKNLAAGDKSGSGESSGGAESSGSADGGSSSSAESSKAPAKGSSSKSSSESSSGTSKAAKKGGKSKKSSAD